MISYLCTINGVNTAIEIGAVITLDGTEQFDNGSVVVKHTTREEPYTEADTVLIQVDGSKSFNLIIQADRVERIRDDLYNHYITLTEHSAKLTKYYGVDRYYSVNGSDLWTHKEIAEIERDTIRFGKDAPYSIQSSTLDVLDTPSPQKKFEGLNAWQRNVDIFRGIKAVPRLLPDRTLFHTFYNQLNNPITLDNLTGWQKDVDFNNYTLGIVSNVQNAAYDGGGDFVAGGTWFPSETAGTTPRSTGGNYSDTTARYQLSFKIREIITARCTNLEISGGTIITDADFSPYVVSKEKWDGLVLGSNNFGTLVTQRAQRNTFYYDINGNIVAPNMADTFVGQLGATFDTRTTIESVIRTWLFDNGYDFITDYVANDIRTFEMQYFYIIYDNINVSSEKFDFDITKRTEVYNGQKDTIVDLGRMGGVLNDIANRMSNGVWVIRQRHYSIDDILDLYDYTADGFKVIKAQYEFYPNHIDATYELAKNWVTIDGYTIVYRSTDPYSIGRDNVESNYRFTEYIEFSTTQRTQTGSLTSQGKMTMLNYLDYDLADDLPVYKAQYTSSDSNQGASKINIEAKGMASLGSQGGMHFVTGFLEPKNAGYRQSSESDGVTTIYKNEPVRYTAEDGYMTSADFEFCHDVPIAPLSYPLGSSSTNDLIQLFGLDYFKNQNEILGLNYELLPCTDEDGIGVTSEFSRKNNLVRLIDIAPTLFLHECLPTTEFTIYDTEIRDSQAVFTVPDKINKSLSFIDVTSVPSLANTTWAISWQDTSVSPTVNRLIMYVNYNGTDRRVIYLNNLKERSTTEEL